MIWYSLDPGLDQTGVAEWQDGLLAQVSRWETSPKEDFAQRLYRLFRFAAGENPPDAVVIEEPRHGGVYRRSAGKEVSLGGSMRAQHAAVGAMVAGFVARNVHVHFLMAPTTPKKTKQLLAASYLAQHGFTPEGRRRVFSPDELDAVFVGIQANGSPIIQAWMRQIRTAA